MQLYASVLGSFAVRKMEEARGAHVLVVGKDRFTRKDLSKVECFNFLACRLLTHVLEELKVPDLAYVYNKLPPAALAMPRVGVVSLAVLGAAFEARGLGDLESYALKHAPKKNGETQLTLFTTMKARELERERTAEKRTKRKN